MKAWMEVIRFRNEDVIATSEWVQPGIIIPEGVCAEIGTPHFATTGRGVYNAASNSTTAPGVGYNYIAPGEMVPNGETSMTVGGQVSIRAGRFYYYNGETYVLCENQPHAR